MANLTGQIIIPQQWGATSGTTGGGTTPLNGTPKSSRTGVTALAAQTSIDLDSDQISSGTTGRLVGILLGGNVRLQATLHTVVDGVASSVRMDFYHPFGATRYYAIPDARLFQAPESAAVGFDGFRMTVTNCEGISSGDILVTFIWEEV